MGLFRLKTKQNVIFLSSVLLTAFRVLGSRWCPEATYNRGRHRQQLFTKLGTLFCVCVCSGVPLYECTSVCVDNLRYYYAFLFFFFFLLTRSLSGPELTKQARLDWLTSELQGSICLCLSSTEITRASHHDELSFCEFWEPNPDLCLC